MWPQCGIRTGVPAIVSLKRAEQVGHTLLGETSRRETTGSESTIRTARRIARSYQCNENVAK